MNMLASFLQGQNAGLANREYRTEQANKSRLSELAPQIMAGDPNAYSQAVAIDPKAAQGYQDAGDAQLRKLQGFIKYVDGARATGNAAAVDAALRQGGSFIQQLTGKAPPTTWTDDMNPGWEDLKARVAMLGSPDGGSSSQNKVIGDALVGPQGNVLYQAERQPEYMWSDRAGAWIPNPNNALISQRQGHAQGTPANPLEQGGTQAQVDADAALANEMIAAGISDAQVDAFLAARMNPNGGSAVAASSGSLEPVRVAGVGPKPEISAAEQIRLTMAERAANRADEAAREASAARQEAADQRRRGEDEKRQKADMAAQQAISSVTDSLGTIQRLRNHPGYRQLGTVMGDAALSTPLIRTDAKGANALLETIKSQMLINTLQSLKAASSTGASGFGSLTEREGDALRAAIANLTTAQSHEDLDAAIGQVESVLTRSQQQLSASSPRQASPDRQQSNAVPQRARNPQTGQVIELRNGQWVPVQ